MNKILVLVCAQLMVVMGCDHKPERKNAGPEKISYKKEVSPVVDSEKESPKLIQDQNITTLSFPNMEGTRWISKIAEDCVNSFHFKKENLYEFYSCEQMDTYYGKYRVTNDTLVLYETQIERDQNLSATPSLEPEIVAFKIIHSENGLRHVERLEKQNGNWVKTNFTFPDHYLYVQKKND